MQQNPNQKPTWGSATFGSFNQPDQIAFIHRVYAWMCGGLVITAFIAYWVGNSATLKHFILGNMFIFYGLMIVELIAVIFLASMVHKISATLAAVVFLLYAALNGFTLSIIFLLYTISSIGSVFIITAGIFGGMSIYGYVTKKDLTTIGNFAIMGLLGLILAMIVNIFLQNNMVSFILSCIGVVIFVLLTAYDTQKLKWLYSIGRTEGNDGEKKEAINGALTLYLDFINLFLDLLRILGKRK
jgi:hypothetical protein